MDSSRRSRPLGARPWSTAGLLLLVLCGPLGAGTPTPDELVDSGGTGGDLFGNAVAVDAGGDVLAVGAWLDSFAGSGNEGSVRVFRFDGTGWNASPKLRSSTGVAGDFFGASVCLSGDVLVVGAPGDDFGLLDDDRGSAKVFRWDGATWNEEQELVSSLGNLDDEFGAAVAVDGDVIAVGAPGYNFTRGEVVVFRWDGASWNEEEHLLGSGFGNRFGEAVSLSGDVLAVGHPMDDVSLFNDGSVRVFRWDGVDWAPDAVLQSPAPEAVANFGTSVAVDGDVLLAGAIHAGADNKGRAFAFRYDGAAWLVEDTLASGDPSSDPQTDSFGAAVGVAGNVAVVGAPDRGIFDSGAATVFRWNGSVWLEAEHLALPTMGSGDVFGSAVAVADDRVFVGAPGVQFPGPGFPQDEQGAAYVYDLSPGPWTNLGGGTVGVAGVPELRGTGTLVAGSVARITVDDAPPGAPMLAWVSFASTPLAAVGGTVHAFPFARQLFVAADGSGSVDLAAFWPASIPSGTDIWFQFVVQDVSVPPGLTLTDAWLASTP